MEKNLIVPGYKGVMELDLTIVDPKYHKDVITQHHKDIDDYKCREKTLKPNMRYENTILKIEKIQQRERKILDQQLNEKRLQQKKQDDERYMIFLKNQEYNKKLKGIIEKEAAEKKDF